MLNEIKTNQQMNYEFMKYLYNYVTHKEEIYYVASINHDGMLSLESFGGNLELHFSEVKFYKEGEKVHIYNNYYEKMSDLNFIMNPHAYERVQLRLGKCNITQARNWVKNQLEQSYIRELGNASEYAYRAISQDDNVVGFNQTDTDLILIITVITKAFIKNNSVINY